jgi:glycosyltransferase involved in cell wall biosynthesis
VIRSILWLTQETPDPTLGGGALRQAGLLRELAQIAPVDLVLAGSPPAPAVAAAVRRVILVPPQRPRTPLDRARAARAMLPGGHVPEVDGARDVRRALRATVSADADLAGASVTVATHLPLAPLLPHLPGAAVFHPFHAVAAQLRGEAGRAAGFRALRLRRYAASAGRLERWAVSTAAATVAVSEGDAALLAAGTGRSVDVVGNAVDLAPGDAAGRRPEAPTVLFPASLDYAPNADGARWMAQEIWPAVRRARPDARLLLVGRAPGPEVQALAGLPGVEVQADVPDMVEWMARARVVVVPLRFGTGTRIKALEAMAARRPVVGTPIGLAGLGIDDGVHALVADDAASFAERVVEALGPRGDALVGPGRCLVEAHHTWPAAAAELAAVLDRVAGSAP